MKEDVFTSSDKIVAFNGKPVEQVIGSNTVLGKLKEAQPMNDKANTQLGRIEFEDPLFRRSPHRTEPHRMSVASLTTAEIAACELWAAANCALMTLKGLGHEIGPRVGLVESLVNKHRDKYAPSVENGRLL